VRKSSGKWIIVREQVSEPVDLATGKGDVTDHRQRFAFVQGAVETRAAGEASMAPRFSSLLTGGCQQPPAHHSRSTVMLQTSRFSEKANPFKEDTHQWLQQQADVCAARCATNWTPLQSSWVIAIAAIVSGQMALLTTRQSGSLAAL
jgi:hypothetical protein